MGQVFGRDCFLDNFKAGKQTLEVNENGMAEKVKRNAHN